MFYNEHTNQRLESHMVKHPYLPVELKSDEINKFELYLLGSPSGARPDLSAFENFKFKVFYDTSFIFFNGLVRYYNQEFYKLNLVNPVQYNHLISSKLSEEEINLSYSKKNLGRFNYRHDYEDVSNICGYIQKSFEKISRWNLMYPYNSIQLKKENVKKMEDETTESILKGMGW